MRFRLPAIVLLLAVFPALGSDVPPLVNYQGRLLDDGVPTDGAFSMTFRIFDDPTAAAGPPCGDPSSTCKWEETQTVTVTKGIFNVLLGSVDPSGNPLDETVFSDPDRWLEIEVAGEVMSQRQRIASAAYAIKAGPSTQADHSCPSDMVSAGSYCIDQDVNAAEDATWFQAAIQHDGQVRPQTVGR